MEIRYFRMVLVCVAIIYVLPTDGNEVVLLDTTRLNGRLNWTSFSSPQHGINQGWKEVSVYIESISSSSLKVYTSCYQSSKNVNDWLRTPFIEVQEANSLYIEVNFTMRRCVKYSDPGSLQSCQETFNLYFYQADRDKANVSLLPWDGKSYTLIDKVAASVLGESASDININTETRFVSLTPGFRGIYFAFQDTGACLAILSVKIVYKACPSTIYNYAYFPTTPTGRDHTSAVAREGKCVKNASPILTPVYRCLSDGSWDIGTGGCQCDQGFEGIDNKCFRAMYGYNCSFSHDMCGWKQNKLFDIFDWSRTNGPTSWVYSGHIRDHQDPNGSFITLEQTSLRQPGDYARITGPSIDLSSKQIVCFSFWYYMDTITGHLTVSTYDTHIYHSVWKKQGPQGNTWKQVQLSITGSGPIQIFIEGAIGKLYFGGIAVDDTILKDGKCPEHYSPAVDTTTKATNGGTRMSTGQSPFVSMLSTYSGSSSKNVRLVNDINDNSCSGRVEVFHNGRWGTICDYNFDNNDAKVICRMLGLYRGEGYGRAYSGAHFGVGSGDILLDNLQCHGYESDISNCKSYGWGNHACTHAQDAGVDCYAYTSTALSTLPPSSTVQILPHLLTVQTLSPVSTVQRFSARSASATYKSTNKSWFSTLYRTTYSPSLDHHDHTGVDHNDAIYVGCNAFSWNISLNLPLLRHKYPNLVSSDIYLGENKCNGIETNGLLVFRYGLDECLTNEVIQDDGHVYNNELVYAEHDPVYTFIIKHYNWTYTVTCDPSKYSTTTGSIPNTDTSLLFPKQQYPVNVSTYLDSSFTKEVPNDPLHADIGSTVYVKVFSTASDWNTYMRVRTCYTKPTTNASDHLKYYLITNGCEQEATTHIISETTHETRLMFDNFEYTDRRNEGIFVFCDVIFCRTSDLSRQCLQPCNPAV